MVYVHEKLKDFDAEVHDLVEAEQEVQLNSIQLIASENYTSKAVLETLSSCLSVLYVDGYPREGDRSVEILAQKRSLEAFKLNPDQWGVNVRALSGTTANFAVYSAILQPHDRIMGLHVADGGHSSHGYYTNDHKKISASSIYFENLPYHVNPETGDIDYDKLFEYARLYRPKLIIAGASCFSRLIDYKKFRVLCDEVNAILMADMAHVAGLVAGGVIPSPFEYADIVNTTTHKSLRGPKGALIFYKKKFEKQINEMVYPGFYGGAHNHVMGAIAVAMKEAASEEFRQYAHQIVKNSRKLCEELINKGYRIIGGVTDNHVFLINVRPLGLDARQVEELFTELSILVTKTTCPGDTDQSSPHGIRIGTPAITSRGTNETHMSQIAEFIHEALQLAISNSISETEKQQLKYKINTFSKSLPIPGFY